MFEQDYIMRLVHEIARVLAKILFNIDSETVSEEFLKENHYSRGEVKEGIEDVAERVGLSGLINTLFIE